MTFSLTSIFSSFLDSGDPMAAVQTAQLQIEARVGQFLTTGQQISDLKTQADGQKSSSNSIVADKAAALSSQASALLTQYGNIKTDATALINDVISLKDKISSDPAKYADSGSGTVYGWRVMDVLSQNKNQVIQATADSASMIKRIDTYTDQVNQLQNDVADLINFAQGKGLSATLASIGGAYTGIAKTGVAVGVGALAIYFLAPSFLPKIMKSVKGK
jgi:hypothetical protein